MMKKYLFNLMIVLAFGLTIVGCSGDDNLTEVDYKRNAESIFGVNIAPNQDWQMAKTAVANITVNKTLGETYTVTVYSNNPLVDSVAYVLTRGTVENGETFTASFDYASALSSLYVGVTDKYGFSTYKIVPVENGMLTATFGESTAASHRSQSAPTVPGIEVPYDEAWVAAYCETATEPNSTNIADNYNNCYYERKQGTYVEPYVTYYAEFESKYPQANYGWDWSKAVAAAQADGWEHFDDLFNYVQDANWVLNFKITGTQKKYNGVISVLATEGYTDGVANGNQRTVVVTGTWHITDDQKVGSLGRVIVANGGKIDIANNKKLELVNEARLIVLPGGEITGGNIVVANGNASGMESYNGGTINVNKFNNNFGKFYNYGTFKTDIYGAGSQESNFYNHGKAIIGTTKENKTYISSNARFFNACQLRCKGDLNARNIEMGESSYMQVDGELMMSVSQDGTSDASYVGLASGALVKCTTLKNNGTSWTGPTGNDYAVVSIGKITYLNWAQDTHPLTYGYFENNIYVEIKDDTNFPEGNGWESWNAAYKFWKIVANGLGGETTPRGNGGVTKVESDSSGVEVIPADEDFTLGVRGCTPGYKGKGNGGNERSQVYTYAFEDTFMGDYDMNDVVIQVWNDETNSSKLKVKLCCTGASFNLYVYLRIGDTDVALFGGREVHAVLAGTAGKFINTGTGEKFENKDAAITTIDKPAGFSFNTADFWIKSPQGNIHWLSTREESAIGNAPYGVMIPTEWAWPKEWTPVNQAYEQFAAFAAGNSEGDLWYMTPSEGKTY